jgi:hypothetical protein
MTSIPQDRSSVTLEGTFGAAELRQFCAPGRFDSLSLTKQPLITARIAKELSALESVKTLWLWCPITRTAMRHVISMPDLEILDILRFRGPGALENFSGATALKEVRCNGGMSEADLLAIAELPNVEELAAQWSALTLRALEAILGMPKLHRLDLEATPLDDEMAKALAKSSNIDMLEIGATRVTAAGLRDICTMSQLHYLDIWQLDIPARRDRAHNGVLRRPRDAHARC